jgi:hypothetical protein
MSDNNDSSVSRVYRVIWRDRAGVLHASAPRFLQEVKARRWANLLRRDPAVVETRIMPVVLWPLLPRRPPPAA